MGASRIVNGKYAKGSGTQSLVYGVGICDALTYDNGSATPNKSYTNWAGMFRRCYSKKYLQKKPSYKGCKVSKEWLLYTNFIKWHDKEYIDGYHLDKDILKDGNKEYGPKTCCYVPLELNSLLTDSKRARGKYPQGVSLDVKRNRRKLKVSIHRYGKQYSLGRFDLNDVESAVDMYRKAKADYIKQLAKEYKSKIKPKVYKALIWRANNGVF